MERQVIGLIAQDRLELPLSSMDQKLRRGRLAQAKKIADSIGVGNSVEDERVFAYVEEDVRERARGTKQAIAEFETEFPKYGAILRGKIAEKRAKRDVHLYFGVNAGKKLTRDDYVQAMVDSGLTPHVAHMIYPVLMDVSRRLDSARDHETRSIVVGKYD